MSAAADICVVGAGVIGLTSAIVLAEAGYRVRVVARDAADDTTSAVAGGLCWPYRIRPYEEAVRWSLRSLEVFTGLAGRPAETGTRLVAGVTAEAAGAGAAGGEHGPAPEEGLDAWYAAVPGLRPARAEELPPGCGAGWRARTPLVEMPVHLRYLERRLAAAGGTVVARAVTSLAEAADGVRAVVNCSGLGARELVPDGGVHPVQGQLVIVENPGIAEWFTAADAGAEDTAYVLPQPFGLVLGGTAREGAWSREPDPAVAEAIVARCARYFPQVARARVLAHRVGLRPARPAVRLAAERLPDGTVCVHNYGHGGAGVTVSWGCADEVLRLVRDAVAPA
ncbi:FAD-dependent oxidoreductase [Streptomyces noursei]|uniref:FAD-dependent oxidoreductase n=1 Tax=Streptomyces noursei TaxID=1971 RepID=UPI001674599A|nr:FAD-dependent oxidoreductase [Streptomyces noursei]MCZ1019211.1 FAD-dependent oxidoreductase [Streptomyces noursei]GGX29708.1 amino acid oxidase [Streptomyces noursei]